MAGLTYRPEISGLRAIAVLAVIVYHAGVARLPGGFVGVDIFFVISGFLITTILYRQGMGEGIAFAEFYARRVKRLVPASTAMVVTTVAAGYALLYAEEYANLAASALYSLFFTANFYFLGHTGYFDQSTEISPLVHMWSLGMEEQFYLLYPALVAGAMRLKRPNGLPFVLLAIVAASFLTSLYLSEEAPNFAFYMLPTRAWELGLGGLIALPWAQRRLGVFWSSLLSAAGVVMIGYGSLTVTSADPFPGLAAVLPVVGTALAIFATGVGRNPVGWLLGSWPLRIVGESSYSAYLWHWPIIVFYRIYLSDRAFTATEQIMLIGLTLMVGWISWRLIEQPFRTARVPAQRALSLAAVTVAMGAIVPTVVGVGRGLPNRIPSELLAITDSTQMSHWDCVAKVQLPFGDPGCVVGLPWKRARVRGIVIGDSHASHFAPVLHEAAKEAGVSLAVVMLRCAMRFDGKIELKRATSRNYSDACYDQHDRMVAWFNRDPGVQSLTVAWAWSSGQLGRLVAPHAGSGKQQLLNAEVTEVGLAGLIERLDLSHKHLLLLGDVPRPWRPLNSCVAMNLTPLLRAPCDVAVDHLDAETVLSRHKPTDDVLIARGAWHPSITALIPTQRMCGPARCDTFINGEFIYRDGHHLRRNLAPDTLRILSRQLGLVDYFTRLRKELEAQGR
jgi:peptidoglycan/LPS O-acetylase OafA/YrhL